MQLDEARLLAEKLFKEHLLLDWKFEFDSAERRFGYCRHNVKIISLSKILTELNTPERVLDTLKHEIAHALVGHSFGHSIIWKRKAKELGCSANRCYTVEDTVVPIPKKGYIYKCIKCGQETSTSYKWETERACKKCCYKYNGGTFNRKYLFKFLREIKENA